MVLEPFKITLLKEDYFNYAGKRGDIIEAELIKNYNLKIEKGALLNKKEELLIEWFGKKKLKLMSYVKEAVEFFVNNDKIKLGLASGGPRDEVIIKLKRNSFYSFFPIIVSGSDVERGKPYPDIYLLAAEKLGLKPTNCIAFEDTEYGVASAKSAGLICFAIPGEFSKKTRFFKSG